MQKQTNKQTKKQNKTNKQNNNNNKTKQNTPNKHTLIFGYCLKVHFCANIRKQAPDLPNLQAFEPLFITDWGKMFTMISDINW